MRAHHSFSVEWTRKKRPRSADGLHAAVADYLDAALPIGSCWFVPKSTGLEKTSEAAPSRHKGVTSGLPDIVVFWNRRAFCLALKSDRGMLSDQQRTAKAAIGAAGVPLEVARSLAEVKERLIEFGFPLRDASGGRPR